MWNTFVVQCEYLSDTASLTMKLMSFIIHTYQASYIYDKM